MKEHNYITKNVKTNYITKLKLKYIAILKQHCNQSIFSCFTLW